MTWTKDWSTMKRSANGMLVSYDLGHTRSLCLMYGRHLAPATLYLSQAEACWEESTPCHSVKIQPCIRKQNRKTDDPLNFTHIGRLTSSMRRHVATRLGTATTTLLQHQIEQGNNAASFDDIQDFTQPVSTSKRLQSWHMLA